MGSVQRLDGADAYLLSAERPAWPMHTGALVVVEPAPGAHYGFATVHARFAERIASVPEFTMKLQEVPFGLDQPLLVPDPDFDLARHLHRAAVPRPGGPREVAELVGTLLERPLDRRYPLWEIWVIEGLEHGRVGVFAKVHHALADGVSGAGLATVLCDLAPDDAATGADGAHLTTTPVPDRQHAASPGTAELAARGLVAAATVPYRLTDWAVRGAARFARVWPSARRAGAHTFLDPAPRVRWNGELGAKRAVAFTSVPLGRVREVRRRFGVTVNDVVLALCADTLRHYLLAHGELPTAPLVASVPISVRDESDTTLGNQISLMFVPLATDVADPAERLVAVSRAASTAKEIGTALRHAGDRRLSQAANPALAQLFFGLFQRAHLESTFPTPSNLVISNVPGSPIELYSGRARIRAIHPVPPLLMGQGLNCTVMSYGDTLGFGFTADRDMVPDVATMAAGIPRALDLLDEPETATHAAPA